MQIKKKKLFNDLKRHSANRIFPEGLPGLHKQAVILFRPMMMNDPGIAAVLDGARLSYSMWDGYLKEESMQPVVAWLRENEIEYKVIHTSGHAFASDLQRFASALAPRMLVPIHSFETSRFAEFFNNVVRKDDGEWWSV